MDRKIRNNLRQKLLHNKNRLFDSYNNQIRILFLIVLLISSWVLTQTVQIYARSSEKLQEGIADEIIRFHVIANSDSYEDQDLKYQVKDALVHALKPYLKDAKDIDEAQDIIEKNLPLIKDVASRLIEDKGYTYSVSASLSYCYFPMKVYGDYTFPPGAYKALQVRLGDARGKNWWCVMFPPLCFVDETYSIVDEDGEEKLKYLLTEEEFDALKNEKVPVKIRFKLLEAIKKLFD